MSKTYNLDRVSISPRVYQSWLYYCPMAVADLKKKYPDIQSSEVPDEQFRVGIFGAEIFIKIRGAEIKMKVPRDEYVIT